MYVGDRSGTIFRVRPGKHPEVLTTLPPSIAAYHLAAGTDGGLFVSGPTLTAYDHVYRVTPDGHHEIFASGFGRPQGLALEGDRLLVADALAGSSAVHRLGPGEARARVVAGEGLIGLAFDPHGGLVVSSNDTVYRFDDPARPLCAGPRAMTHLFRRKPIADLLVDEHDSAQQSEARPRCRRSVMLSIGAVIGAGIFGAIGTAAAGQVDASGHVVRAGAGPALVFSFLLLGGACALSALCYAELAAMIPQAGSAYAYSYATLGELVAWIIGWDLILEYAVGNVAVAISWGTTSTR